MDRAKIQKEFEDALTPNKEDVLAKAFAKIVCGLLVFVGLVATVGGFSNLSNVGSRAAEIQILSAYASILSGLLVLALACIIGLLIALVEDNRALKKLVRRVSAGVVKTPNKPSA